MPRILFAGALLVTGLLLLFAVAVPFMLSENRARTGHHVIDYTVRISSDKALENLTLLLPLPYVNGTSAFGEGLAYGSGYGVPHGWNISLEPVNGSQYLKITDAQLIPERAPYPVPTSEDEGENRSRLRENLTIRTIPLATTGVGREIRNESAYAVRIGEDANGTVISRELPVTLPVKFGVREMVAAEINTRDPLDAEPLLWPKEGLHEAGCSAPVSKTTRCFAYTSPVYLDYRPGEPANIDISVSVRASNEWWELGWSSNYYADRMTITPAPGEKGWMAAEGILMTGNGRY